MIVDVNLHWDSENRFKDKFWLNAYPVAARTFGNYAEMTTLPGTNIKQLRVSYPKGYENLNCAETSVDIKSRLEGMDQGKIDKGILRIAVWQQWFNLEMCMRANNEMAQCVREHPDRLLGLAAVPPYGDDESTYELERCVKELGLSGVLCASHYGNIYLDDEQFKPYFKKLNQLGVPVCIHHTPLPVEYNSLIKYTNLRRPVGRCIEQIISLSRILSSRMLDEFPNLKLIFTMLGGGYFAFTNMIAPERSELDEEMERFDTETKHIRNYLDRNIYFDMSHAQVWGKKQLESAVKILGAEHILFGSSFPLRREWLVKGVDYIKSLDIGEQEKTLILGENAVKLFNIKA
jgi:predicted TIM-barrel fold metal-dependent hydrolase